jgi:hypothetical protein
MVHGGYRGRILLPATLVALALAGCGDKTLPAPAPAPAPPPVQLPSGVRGGEPREPLDRAVDRLRTALHDQDCAALLGLFHPDVGAPAPVTCQGTLRGFIGATVVASQRFDSAALIRFRLRKGGLVEVIEALDRTGHFRLVFFAGEARSPQAPNADADRYAAAALQAIKAGRCKDLAAYFARYAPGASTGPEICALRHVRLIRDALRAAHGQQLGRVGGNGSVAFYTLRLDDRTPYTVVLIALGVGAYRYGYGVRSG